MGGRPWTRDELEHLYQLQDLGYDIATIATALGTRDSRAVRNRIAEDTRRGRRELPSVAAPPPPVERVSTLQDVHDFLTLPPQPFAVPVPAAATASGAPAVAVVYGDTHVPYQDAAALKVVFGIIRDAKPDLVVHLGDLLDCYTISRYSRDPTRRTSLQDEIDLARKHLHQVAQLAPKARRVLLEGNHEDRLRKVIWDLPGGAAELARLTAFQAAMTWPNLLQLDAIGWEFRPYAGQARAERLIPKLILKHGTRVNRWSTVTARNEWLAYGKSGASGHVHRLGVFYHRDQNGSHVWAEAGCTCTLQPEYMDDPDWQQACLVITTTGDRFNIEPVYIEKGVGIWRGRRYTA